MPLVKPTLKFIKLGTAGQLVAEVRFNDVNDADEIEDPPDWLGGWYDRGTKCLVITDWKGALNTLDSAVDIVRDWGNTGFPMDPSERSERAATIRLYEKVRSLAPKEQ